MGEVIKRVLVTASHLARKAVVYLRQSTRRQVAENEGSTEHQRNQAAHARRLGFAPDAIEEIDDDLGVSGASTHRRHGYARMLNEIKAGLVGAVFVAEYSRLGRNLREAVTFVDECRIHDVLIVVDGRVHNLRDGRDRFMATLLLNCAELENDGLRDRLNNGKLAKAMMGIAVSPPPAGYIAEKGQWLLDPDERVRLAVATVFRVFLAERTLIRTAAKLVEMGVQLPRRERHTLDWVPPEVGAIGFMIRNRSYAGHYVFRRRVVDQALGRSGNGRMKDRPSREDEVIIVQHHHEPYVTQEQWDEMQQILKNNTARWGHRNPGRGDALLQGLLACAKHPTRKMAPKYKTLMKGKSHHGYVCHGDLMFGGKRCRRTKGVPLERAVVAAVAARLCRPRIENIRSEWRQHKAEALIEKRREEVQLERLRQNAADLERRYMLVDPANRFVAAGLEAKLNAAQRELKMAEASPCRTEVGDLFSEEAFAELVELCGDFERIWNAPTTGPEDRKQILGTLLEQVVVEHQDREQIRARIVWADDGTETPLDVRLNDYAHRLIRELDAQGVDSEAIAKRLNDEQILTLRSNRWTRQAVVMSLWRSRKGGGPDSPGTK